MHLTTRLYGTCTAHVCTSGNLVTQMPTHHVRLQQEDWDSVLQKHKRYTHNELNCIEITKYFIPHERERGYTEGRAYGRAPQVAQYT